MENKYLDFFASEMRRRADLLLADTDIKNISFRPRTKEEQERAKRLYRFYEEEGKGN